METALAGIVMFALVAYVLTGGADFGAGVWHALVSGPKAPSQRKAIEDAVQPIWEVNQVWLFLVGGIGFAGFPRAFSLIAASLTFPLGIASIGFLIRAGALIWRRTSQKSQIAWARLFQASSILTPFFMGICVGAVCSGNIAFDLETGLVQANLSDWLAPFPIVMGLFAVAIFAYLAAVYMTVECDGTELADEFRSKAIASGIMVGAFALLGILLAQEGAPLVLENLSGETWSIPFHVVTGTAAIAALWALWQRRFRLARGLAVVQVAMVILGWGGSQFPYVVVPHITVASGAADGSVLQRVFVAVIVTLALFIPLLVLFLRTFKRRVQS